jgi:hypothetical protein
LPKSDHAKLFDFLEHHADLKEEFALLNKPISKNELPFENKLPDFNFLKKSCEDWVADEELIALMEHDLIGELKEIVEKKLAKYRKRVRRWTPLLKFYTAEKCVEMARTCLQIHGGYGYTTEYKAEWWMRESLILPIYEGTSQIQALMCIKDTLKDVIRNPKAFIEVALGMKVQTLRENDPLRKKFYRARKLENSAVISILLRLLKANARASISEAKPNDLLRMVKMLSRDLIKMENVGPALQHAERVVEIKALTNLAYSLIMDAEIDESRKRYAERFLNKMLPRIAMLKEEIEMDDPIIGGILAGYAEAAGEDVRSEGA